MADDISDHLLERYCAGDCAPPERAEVERWIGDDPARLAFVQMLRAAWLESATVNLPERPDAAAAWRRVERRMRWTDRPPLHAVGARLPASSARRRVAWPALAAAAAAAILVGGTFLLASVFRRTDAAPIPLREVTTRPGQRADLHLSDGTHVLLGVKSHLRFAPTLGASSRDVYLDGEALFEVKHDTGRPFLVHTANAITEDLGTRFAVRAYPGDSTLTVVVAEGKVALRSGLVEGNGTKRAQAFETRVVLGDRDLARLGIDGRLTTERGVRVERYLAWTEGRLVFVGTPLRDAIPDLARWYGLEFHAADSAIAARRLTATFVGESANEALRNMALALDAGYRRDGHTVTFFSKLPTP